MSLQLIQVYKMKNDFSHEVKIIEVGDLDIQETTGSVIMSVNDLNLKCFSTSFSVDGPFLVGQTYTVKISLMTTLMEKIISEQKDIKTTSQFLGHCILFGKIQHISPKILSFYDPKKDSWYQEEDKYNKNAVVDCGIFVAVEIPKDSDLKMRDYIKAEGRLDVKKIKE